MRLFNKHSSCIKVVGYYNKDGGKLVKTLLIKRMGLIGVILVIIGIGYPLGFIPNYVWWFTLYPGLIFIITGSFLKK